MQSNVYTQNKIPKDGWVNALPLPPLSHSVSKKEGVREHLCLPSTRLMGALQNSQSQSRRILSAFCCSWFWRPTAGGNLTHHILQTSCIVLRTEVITSLKPDYFFTMTSGVAMKLWSQYLRCIAGNLPVYSSGNWTTSCNVFPVVFLSCALYVSAQNCPTRVFDWKLYMVLPLAPFHFSFILSSNITFRSLFDQTSAGLCSCFYEA